MAKSTRTRIARKSPTAVVETPVTAPEVAPPAAITPVKVRKSMKGVNASGNTPWRKKLYGINLEAYAAGLADGSVRKMAGQVQGMLRYMASDHFQKDLKGSARGGEVCYHAIDKGFIVTKIEPDVLFAYYRKTMEDAGWLTFLGYTA